MSAADIDTSTNTVTLSDVPGYGIASGMPYYAFNLLEEITQPGEFYLNRDTGVLYFWPPADPTSSETVVSLLEGPLVRIQEAGWVTVQNLTLEATRTRLVEVEGGNDNTLYKLRLHNAGTSAGSISGQRNTVDRCEISNPGDGGLDISGGDRPSLTPSGHVVQNCHIHHFSRFARTYKPGIRLSGVGHTVRHNLIHDAPPQRHPLRRQRARDQLQRYPPCVPMDQRRRCHLRRARLGLPG